MLCSGSSLGLHSTGRARHSWNCSPRLGTTSCTAPASATSATWGRLRGHSPYTHFANRAHSSRIAQMVTEFAMRTLQQSRCSIWNPYLQFLVVLESPNCDSEVTYGVAILKFWGVGGGHDCALQYDKLLRFQSALFQYSCCARPVYCISPCLSHAASPIFSCCLEFCSDGGLTCVMVMLSS